MVQETVQAVGIFDPLPIFSAIGSAAGVAITAGLVAGWGWLRRRFWG